MGGNAAFGTRFERCGNLARHAAEEQAQFPSWTLNEV